MFGCTALISFSNSDRVTMVLQSAEPGVLPDGLSHRSFIVMTGASGATEELPPVTGNSSTRELERGVRTGAELVWAEANPASNRQRRPVRNIFKEPSKMFG